MADIFIGTIGFIVGLFMFLGAPVIGLFAHNNGVDGPVVFGGVLLGMAIGLGLITGTW